MVFSQFILCNPLQHWDEIFCHTRRLIMQAISRKRQNPRPMPVSSGALPDDYFAAGGATAVEEECRRWGIHRRRFCRWSWRSLASVGEVEKSEQSPEDLSTFKLKVRIYYLKMRFIQGFAMIWPTHLCAAHEQCNRTFLSYSPVDNEK